MICHSTNSSDSLKRSEKPLLRSSSTPVALGMPRWHSYEHSHTVDGSEICPFYPTCRCIKPCQSWCKLSGDFFPNSGGCQLWIYQLPTGEPVINTDLSSQNRVSHLLETKIFMLVLHGSTEDLQHWMARSVPFELDNTHDFGVHSMRNSFK